MAEGRRRWLHLGLHGASSHQKLPPTFTMEHKPQEADPRLGGSDSGIWCTGLMFSDLFLDAEYLVENLLWSPEICNRLKCSAVIEVGTCVKLQPHSPTPGKTLKNLCRYPLGPCGYPLAP